MYQKSVWDTKYTSYSRWLSFPFRASARRYFPILYKKQTGLDLQKEWKDPPINSITKTYINRMCSLGFEPEQTVDEEYYATGVSLPLLVDRRQLGGFLVAYKPRRKSSFLRWVKYTHPKLVASETPLMAISGPFRQKPNGLLVDNLSDYFKLLNWVYCQAKTYALGPRGILPSIIYVDQGEEGVIEQMRKMQLYFNHLTDFTGKFVEEIKSKMHKTHGAFNVDTFHYFDENPLPYCYNRIQYEDAMTNLKSSFPRKTPLVYWA